MIPHGNCRDATQSARPCKHFTASDVSRAQVTTLMRSKGFFAFTRFQIAALQNESTTLATTKFMVRVAI